MIKVMTDSYTQYQMYKKLEKLEDLLEENNIPDVDNLRLKLKRLKFIETIYSYIQQRTLYKFWQKGEI